MSAWSDEVRRGLKEWLASIAAEVAASGTSPLDLDREVRAARAHYEEWHPQPRGPDAATVDDLCASLVCEWRTRERRTP